MSGESHFHPCPSCQSAVECLLPIGDGDCGKLRCASCSPKSERPYCQVRHPAKAIMCTLKLGHGGSEHVAHGVADQIVGRWLKADSDETADDSEDDEEEAESCDNCGEDITPDNPAMDFDGDSLCKSCWPDCKDCEEPIKADEQFRCERCDEYLCEDCAKYCRCCEEYFCESHANDHGI